MKNILFISILLLGLLINSCADPCDDINCGANGTCIEGICNCELGYEGTNCEITSRDKFIGDWLTNNWSCDNDPTKITMESFTVIAGTTINEVVLFADGLPGLNLMATITGNNLVIPSQEHNITGDELIFSGTGDMNDNMISVSITYAPSILPLSTITCTGLLE